MFVFRAVAQYSTTTMIAGWRQSVNGTLKAVKNVCGATQRHLKCLVVIVSTDFAFHGKFLPQHAPANAVPPVDIKRDLERGVALAVGSAAW